MKTATLEEAAVDVSADPKSNKPVETFRHRHLSASVFANISKGGTTFHTVVLQRTYKDGEEFKHSSSFLRDEIPIAQHLLAQAWEFVLDAESK